jgi:hypothetical protein
MISAPELQGLVPNGGRREGFHAEIAKMVLAEIAKGAKWITWRIAEKDFTQWA